MAKQPNVGTPTPKVLSASNAASAPTKPRQKQANVATPPGLTPVHLERKMKVYPVTEPELTALSDANTFVSVFGSLSATAFGSAATLWSESKISAPVTPEGTVLLAFGPPVLVIVGVVFAALAALSLWRRKTVITEIRNSAVEAKMVQRT